MRWSCCFIVALVLVSGSFDAIAEPSAADIAAAEELFRQARAAMEREAYDKACALFEESLRLERATGTLWHLGRCYEATERLASAWAAYLELAAEARRLDEPRKVEAARQRAAKLEPRIPRLVIELAPDGDVEGLAVFRDGRRVAAASLGAALPVDAGLHRVRAVAPHHQPWETTVQVSHHGETRILIPQLARQVAQAAPLRVASEPWYRDRLGWTLAIGGAAVAAGGAAALLHASALDDDAEAANRLDEAQRLRERAADFRLGGGAGLALGAAITAVGVTRLILVPKPTSRRWSISATTGSATLFVFATGF